MKFLLSIIWYLVLKGIKIFYEYHPWAVFILTNNRRNGMTAQHCNGRKGNGERGRWGEYEKIPSWEGPGVGLINEKQENREYCHQTAQPPSPRLRMTK